MAAQGYTGLLEFTVESVRDVSRSKFAEIVAAKGRQLFGDFYYEARAYDRSTQTGRFVLARRPVRNLARVLRADATYYLRDGETFYVIDAEGVLTISQQVPEEAIDIETLADAKRGDQLRCSVRFFPLWPIVFAFVGLMAAMLFMLNQARSRTAEALSDLSRVQASAPAPQRSAARLPDMAPRLGELSELIQGHGYIEKIELSGEALQVTAMPDGEQEAIDMARAVGGEVKDGKVQFRR